MTPEDISRISLAHSIKSLEVLYASIKYWQSPEDIKELIQLEIKELRKSLRLNRKDDSDVGYVGANHRDLKGKNDSR